MPGIGPRPVARQTTHEPPVILREPEATVLCSPRQRFSSAEAPVLSRPLALILRRSIGLVALALIIDFQRRRPAQERKPFLDPAAVKSQFLVRTLKGQKGDRKLVVLGKPTGTTGIPEHGPLCRLDMLPRELVRQAVLIAARDELGASTRDQVIDDTSQSLQRQRRRLFHHPNEPVARRDPARRQAEGRGVAHS